MQTKQNVTIIGLMSGTSLDGLDICAVNFHNNTFTILKTKHIPYSSEYRNKLDNAYKCNGQELTQLDVDFGKFCGNEVKRFINDSNPSTALNDLKVDYIASHGQTVFHTPNTGLTLQIGSGAHIASITGIPTINDFRSLDVAMGGQGAPLVPIGDELLFNTYTYCLNIGGFANVSTNNGKKRIAWDICPTNIVLNEFAKKYGKEYDKSGELGNKGSINSALLEKLNALPFYMQSHPKSLGREWVDENMWPLLNAFDINDFDKMRTLYEHMGMQIGQTLSRVNSKTLCTGGGTYNKLLVSCIKNYTPSDFIIPSNEIIDFKEALIFAFLGYLRIQNKPNCLASVTGAKMDVCGGVIHCMN